jgi:hypothetical protein
MEGDIMSGGETAMTGIVMGVIMAGITVMDMDTTGIESV